MTRPAVWRRSTAAQRRQRRADYNAIKAAWEASPECAAYQAANRYSDCRNKLRRKLRQVAAGRRTNPFSAVQLSVLRPVEANTLLLPRVRDRLAALTPEERQQLRGNLHLIPSVLTDEDFRAIVCYGHAAKQP